MAKFLFVIPAQDWNMVKKLVCIVHVPMVVIYTGLEIASFHEICPDLEEELVR